MINIRRQRATNLGDVAIAIVVTPFAFAAWVISKVIGAVSDNV